MSDGFKTFITAPERVRLDIFLAASRRLGAALPERRERLLGLLDSECSLSRASIGKPAPSVQRWHISFEGARPDPAFSEDIDITVFREDPNQAASIEEMEKLPGKKRRAKLDAIRDACHAWVAGPLHENLATQIQEFIPGDGRIEVDVDDPDGQTLVVWYPSIAASEPGYMRPAVRIECGAKSALDPHQSVLIQPYISVAAPGLDLSVPEVTTIERLEPSGIRS